jgi:hypothetical protein
VRGVEKSAPCIAAVLASARLEIALSRRHADKPICELKL